MWKLFLIYALAIFSRDVQAVVLNRNQLSTWCPDYLTNTTFNLVSRQITTISTDTFTGLTQLQWLFLSDNELASLDASLFSGLSQLHRLFLENNQLTSLDASIFNGLSQVYMLSLKRNQLTYLDTSLFN